MAAIIGFSSLLLVFSISVFLLFNISFTYHSFNNDSHLLIREEKIAKILLFLLFISAVLAQISLIYSFIISDYSVSNVYQNSHHLKPLIYKIAGSWGNHEGSMLLLITILCGYCLLFNNFSNFDRKTKLVIIAIKSGIIALFAAFTAFASNPFLRIFPVPEVGLGLNPVLQDIGLALHPPMLYVGYLGFALIFAFAIAGLILEKVDRDFALYLKPWLFFAFGVLTLGIGLGAWWAYRELGWGGYWFWDPVENVSLMPWIAAVALIHSLKILEKRENFKVWTIFLAILSFILCLLGIFLVRSGVLTSVHSFAVDAKRGFFIIAMIVIIGGLAMLLFGFKMHKLKSDLGKVDFISRVGAILLNNYFLVIALVVVLLGTLYPIFLRGLFEEFIAVGPNYYNGIFSVLLLPLLFFLAFSGDFGERKSARKLFFTLRSLFSIFFAGFLVFLTRYYEKNAEILQLIILFLAIFAIFMTFFSFRRNIVTLLAHLGFALMISGIILNSSFGEVKEFNLKQDETFEIVDYKINFSGIEYSDGGNFIARKGVFLVSDKKNGQNLAFLKPELRLYTIFDQSTSETSIRHSLFSDLYMVIGNKDEEENYAVRIYYKPFISLIWLGVLMIFVGSCWGIINYHHQRKY